MGTDSESLAPAADGDRPTPAPAAEPRLAGCEPLTALERRAIVNTCRAITLEAHAIIGQRAAQPLAALRDDVDLLAQRVTEPLTALFTHVPLSRAWTAADLAVRALLRETLLADVLGISFMRAAQADAAAAKAERPEAP